MAQTKIAKAKRRAKPLYHAAKISDYRFRKLLWHFVRDHTSTETASATGLSVNTIVAIYQKLRVYFFQAGLFMDFYGGTGEAAYDPATDGEFERGLLAFHRKRLLASRGVKERPGLPNYHLAESWWRLDFAMIMRERRSDAVYDMMMGQLLAVIRVAGPVGKLPGNPAARRRVLAALIDQKILWFQRYAPSFAHPRTRKGLEDALQTTPRDFDTEKQLELLLWTAQD